MSTMGDTISLNICKKSLASEVGCWFFIDDSSKGAVSNSINASSEMAPSK